MIDIGSDLDPEVLVIKASKQFDSQAPATYAGAPGETTTDEEEIALTNSPSSSHANLSIGFGTSQQEGKQGSCELFYQLYHGLL